MEEKQLVLVRTTQIDILNGLVITLLCVARIEA